MKKADDRFQEEQQKAEDRFLQAKQAEDDRLTQLLADENDRADKARRDESDRFQRQMEEVNEDRRLEHERFEAAAQHAFEMQRLPIVFDAQARVIDAVHALRDTTEELVVAWEREAWTDASAAREAIVALTRPARRELNRFHQICALGWVSSAVDYYTLALHNGVVTIEQNLVPEVFGDGGEFPLRDPLGMLTIIWPDVDAPPPGVPSLTEVLAERGDLHQLNTTWAHSDAMATLVALGRILETWEQAVADTIVEVHGDPLPAADHEAIEVTPQQHELLARAAAAFEHFTWQYADAIRTNADRSEDGPSRWPEFRHVDGDDLLAASHDAAGALGELWQLEEGLDERVRALVDVAGHSVEWVTSGRDELVSDNGALKLVETWPPQPPSSYAVKPDVDNHGMAVLARSPEVGAYLRQAAAMKLVADRLSALAWRATVSEHAGAAT
jgi:hypothetical protein